MSSASASLESTIPPWPAGAELKEYTGGCHCRRFRYALTHPVLEDGRYDVVECNCSFCTPHGKMNIYAPESKFRFVEGTREELSLYQFGKKTVRHYFCPACGVAFLTAAFGHVVVNVRTVDGVDVTRLRIRHVDLANA